MSNKLNTAVNGKAFKEPITQYVTVDVRLYVIFVPTNVRFCTFNFQNNLRVKVKAVVF